jgi:hypothetical protein
MKTELNSALQGLIGRRNTDETREEIKRIIQETGRLHVTSVRKAKWSEVYPRRWDRIRAWVAINVLRLRRSTYERKWYHKLFPYQRADVNYCVEDKLTCTKNGVDDPLYELKIPTDIVYCTANLQQVKPVEHITVTNIFADLDKNMLNLEVDLETQESIQ